MEVSGQLHALAALSLEKDPTYLMNRWMGGPQSRSRRGGEEKNSQPLPGLEPPIIQPVAQRYTTELSRFLVEQQYFLRTVEGRARLDLGPRNEVIFLMWGEET
jgi:hypothetical protein